MKKYIIILKLLPFPILFLLSYVNEISNFFNLSENSLKFFLVPMLCLSIIVSVWFSMNKSDSKEFPKMHIYTYYVFIPFIVCLLIYSLINEY